MTQQANGADFFDPLGVWKQARDANLDAWSKLMIEFVNSEAYARAVGQMLDQYLLASQPFQQVLEKSMTATLAALNMPSRSEVTALAERLTNLELRLDDLDSKLSRLDARLSAVLAAIQAPPGDTTEAHS